MKVIIPVAGEGTRLRPHTFKLPKPLLHIGGKTILDYLVAPLLELDLDEVIFVVGYKGDMVSDFVRENYSFKSTFVHQDKLLGLGYALYVALKEVDSGPIMVLLGDTIIEGDLRKFLAAGKYTLGLRQVDDPTRFGIAELAEGFVVGLEEKPKIPRGDLALIGLYYFSEPDLLRTELEKLIDSGKTTRGEIQLTDALAAMLEAGVKFTPFEVKSWYDCGKKETMLSTNRHLLERNAGHREIEGTLTVPPVYIPESARVENSIVGPYVSVADGTVIKNSIVSNSIIGSHVRIENLVIDESIVGDNVDLKGDKRVLNLGDSTQIYGC